MCINTQTHTHLHTHTHAHTHTHKYIYIAEESADELRKKGAEALLARVLEAVRVSEPSATAEQTCMWIDRCVCVCVCVCVCGWVY